MLSKSLDRDERLALNNQNALGSPSSCELDILDGWIEELLENGRVVLVDCRNSPVLNSAIVEIGGCSVRVV